MNRQFFKIILDLVHTRYQISEQAAGVASSDRKKNEICLSRELRDNLSGPRSNFDNLYLIKLCKDGKV